MTDLRGLLPRTWYAFLARHPRPRPIQAGGIPPILEGGPVLLASATASGKTEAYAAPLAERWQDDLRAGLLRVVVVSPTRALVNDLARRLEGPLGRCGIRLQRRTGDHPKPLEASGAGFLLTTPESLDSLLARHARHLGTVRAVVLDELHVLEGSARGDQVRVLLERLDRVVGALGGQPPQRLAATATLARAEEVARAFLGPEARVVQAEGRRDLEVRLARARDPREFHRELVAACRSYGSRKVLAFVPSRSMAEELARDLAGLPPFQGAVLVHHGSLSRQERERVERAFLAAPAALCFATPTLEVGIDIGDVDMVALAGPPPDVTAFLQRIGRGNRRTGACRVLGLYSGPGSQARFEHLAACAREGRLLVPPVPFRASVLVQQAFSMAWQNPQRFVAAEALAARVPADVAERFPAHRLEELLLHLVGEGWLEDAGSGRFKPSPRLQREFERGRLHHNLDPEGSEDDRVEVVDEHTGRVVGTLLRDAEGNLPRDVSLGGRRRRVVADHGRQVKVRAAPEEAGRARFLGRGAPAVPAPLAEDLAAFLKVDEACAPQAVRERLLVRGHFLGSARAEVLAEVLRPGGGGANPFVAWLATSEEWPEGLTAARLGKLLERRSRRLAKKLAVGPWARLLPAEWLLEDLEALVDPSGMATLLARRRPQEVSGDLAEVLVDLLPSCTRL